MSTTFARLLLEHAAQRPEAPALREKVYGIWQTTTWSALAVQVRELAHLSDGTERCQNPRPRQRPDRSSYPF